MSPLASSLIAPLPPAPPSGPFPPPGGPLGSFGSWMGSSRPFPPFLLLFPAPFAFPNPWPFPLRINVLLPGGTSSHAIPRLSSCHLWTISAASRDLLLTSLLTSRTLVEKPGGGKGGSLGTLLGGLDGSLGFFSSLVSPSGSQDTCDSSSTSTSTNSSSSPSWNLINSLFEKFSGVIWMPILSLYLCKRGFSFYKRVFEKLCLFNITCQRPCCLHLCCLKVCVSWKASSQRTCAVIAIFLESIPCENMLTWPIFFEHCLLENIISVFSKHRKYVPACIQINLMTFCFFPEKDLQRLR